MIKLVASDLDGTIIGKNNTIFETNLKAMNDMSNKNIDFVICTGKTYPIIKGMCSNFNASYGIFGNGNQIINLKTGEEIYKKLLTPSEIDSCIDIARSHNLHIHIYTDNEIISEKELKYMDLRNYKLKKDQYFETSLDISVVDDIKQYLAFNKVNVCKLIVSSDNDLSDIKKEILKSEDLSVTIIKKYGQYKDDIINKEYEYLDITPKNINKDTALKILSNHLHIDNTEIMAIGDNLNDLDMVKNSGLGVAVANAYDELKQVAKYTTDKPVEAGGFAEAVYKFIEF